jgi:predicted site-specific integrase-resolvase
MLPVSNNVGNKEKIPNEDVHMPRMKPPEGYYTLAEARKILNVSNAMIRNYVQKGKISYFLPEGREQGFYLRKHVDELVNELNAFQVMQGKTSSIFDLAREEDARDVVEITRILFGLRGSSEEIINRGISWLKKSPQSFYVLRLEEQVIGFYVMLPLKIQKIKNILDEVEFSQDIHSEEIEEFTPEKPIYLYLMGGVRPGLSHYEKRLYGSRIVAGMMNAIIKLGEKGVTIEELYLRSDTPDGIRVARKLGFTEISSKTYMRNFVIKVKESGIPFIQKYKKALEETQLYKEETR